MRVLVTHPGMQHAHQLAWALEEAGHLAAFWSGVPVVDSQALAGDFWRSYKGGLRPVPIAAERRQHRPLYPLLRVIGTRLLPSGLANVYCHRLDHAFDAWAARRVAAVRPDMVVCYENAALRTFRAARAIGARCVLDAASVHYSAGRALGADAVPANPPWIDAHKQLEIELADAILTCSDFAANTYRVAGVAPHKLLPTPLGTHLPAVAVARARGQSEACRFVFAGSMRRLKGLDLLLDVFEQLREEGVAASLTLIGAAADAELLARARRLPNVTVYPYQPQAKLFELLAAHDCLVLPSRFDAFAMVVAEAMAMGVPAVVSDRVGAQCIIEQHPGAGWIVPFDTAAFKARLSWLVAHPEALATASDAARRAAQDYSWPRYRQRVVTTLERVHAQLGGGVEPPFA